MTRIPGQSKRFGRHEALLSLDERLLFLQREPPPLLPHPNPVALESPSGLGRPSSLTLVEIERGCISRSTKLAVVEERKFWVGDVNLNRADNGDGDFRRRRGFKGGGTKDLVEGGKEHSRKRGEA